MPEGNQEQQNRTFEPEKGSGEPSKEPSLRERISKYSFLRLQELIENRKEQVRQRREEYREEGAGDPLIQRRARLIEEWTKHNSQEFEDIKKKARDLENLRAQKYFKDEERAKEAFDLSEKFASELTEEDLSKDPNSLYAGIREYVFMAYLKGTKEAVEKEKRETRGKEQGVREKKGGEEKARGAEPVGTSEGRTGERAEVEEGPVDLRAMRDSLDRLNLEGLSEQEREKIRADVGRIADILEASEKRQSQKAEQEIRRLMAGGDYLKQGRAERLFTSEGNIEEDMIWFQGEIVRLEAQDMTFSENWQETYPLKIYISSIPKDKQEIIHRFSEIYEDRRRFHDFMWVYRKAGDISPIMDVSNYCKIGVLERIVRGDIYCGKEKKDPVQALIWYQEAAKEVLNLRKELVEIEAKNEPELKKLLSKPKDTRTDYEKKRINELKTEIRKKDKEEKDTIGAMKARLDGFKVVEKSEDEEGQVRKMWRVAFDQEGRKIIDYENGPVYRIGGRLFTALGFAPEYNIILNGVGDFMICRLMNLGTWIINQGEKGGQFFGRGKLWKYWNQKAFVGPLFSGDGLKNFDDKVAKEIGLSEERQTFDINPDKEIRVYYREIVDPQRFKSINLDQFNIDEGALGADYYDQLLKADKFRSYVLSGSGYFRAPNLQTFLKISENLEQVKPDRKRVAFVEPLLRGLIEFYDARRWFPYPERWVLQDKDEEEHREEMSTRRWVKCDAEKVFSKGVGWQSSSIETAINAAVSSGLISSESAELVRQKYLGILGFRGAVGRSVRSFLETSLPRLPLAILGFLTDMIIGALSSEGVKVGGGGGKRK